jgi:hypothetical protein
VDKAMAEATKHFSTEPERVKSRVLVHSCDEAPAKLASVTPAGDGRVLARAYGYYQLSALQTIQSSSETDTSDARNILVLSLNRSHL